MTRRLLTAAALGAACLACAAAPLELQASLAWKGWVRPGRGAEAMLQLSASAPLHVTLEVAAGAQVSRAGFELQPGRPLALHVPVHGAGPVAVTASAPGVAALRRELLPSPSEAPLFGMALSSAGTMGLDGFHALSLVPADLPRSSVAYGSMDALLIDAPTLAALDAPQLGALLAHVAGCGRVAVLRADARVRSLLEGARGCGGVGLLHADSAEAAVQALQAALARPLPAPMSRGALGELARPALADWDRVALALAAAGALLALALLFTASLPVLLALPALAAAAMLLVLKTATPEPQLLIWSEGDSGAQLARYQAWQRFPGQARGPVRVPVPQQMAAGAQPCDPALPVLLELDASRGLPVFAQFDTRLFRQVWFCHAGGFPMARAFDTDMLAGGMRQVRNLGAAAWPAGLLIVGGQAQPLPTLGPGGAARVPVAPAAQDDDAVARVAIARLAPGAAAALWPLEMTGVDGAPHDARGWLLVTAGTAP